MEGSIPPQNSCSEFTGLHQVDRHRNSDPKSHRSDLVGTQWTNEKHNEYLQSMESSFVDQLYESLNLHGALIRKDRSSDSKSSRQHVSTRIPTGQFKVYRDGSWTKINVKRGESPSSNAHESQDLSVNPWVRHFRSGRRHQNVTSSHIQGKSASVSTIQVPVCHPPMCHDESDGSSTEVTDQNFVDEDCDKEVASQTSIINKMKNSVTATPSSDQVVPCKEFNVTEDTGKAISKVKD